MPTTAGLCPGRRRKRNKGPRSRTPVAEHRARAGPDVRPSKGEEPAPGGPVEELRLELQRECDRHLRTRADFENYRRRVERDRDVAGRDAKRGLLLALVGLADGFERALAHMDASPDSVAAGVRGMQRSLRSLLEAEGVKPFESVGERFDPTRHEAVATVRDFDGSPGTVVDEAGRGYLWNDELLRAAQVRVAE